MIRCVLFYQGNVCVTHPTKLSVQHGFAYKEPRQFAGWPANGGIWHWGDEILVRFQIGTYAESNGHGHAIARDKPSRDILARSQDGGETWQPEEIEVCSENPDLPIQKPQRGERCIEPAKRHKQSPARRKVYPTV